MRRNGLWCTLFFAVAQSVIFVALKRFHSFAESKLFLLSSEAIVVVATAIWYVLMQPAPRRKAQQPNEPTVRYIQQPTPPPQEAPQTEKALNVETEEKKRLTEKIRTLEESEIFCKQRLESLEREKVELHATLSEVEGNLVDAQKKTDSCCQTIQSLTFEVDRILTQLEGERRAHSIEVRALLRKDESEETAAQTKKKQAKTALARVATPPLPSLLLLLSACQKGLDLHIANDWPANEHRPLVRRKFFDLAQKMVTTPIAIVSLESPTEYYLSPKLPEGIEVNDVRATILSYSATFEKLKRFEPYHIIDDRLKGRYVAFRAAWDNLEDLIVLAPS
jgi:hypothetical protein